MTVVDDVAELARTARRQRVRQALERTHGNITHAARELEVGIRTLNRWLRSDPELDAYGRGLRSRPLSDPQK